MGYLPQREDAETVFGEWTGQAMCILGVIVWCLSVTREIRAVCLTFLAVRKRSVEGEVYHRTSIRVYTDKWVFSSFAYRRLFVIAVVLLIRIFIACFLLQAGVSFIVHTIDLEDLVLNAVALACILQLDEHLFEALAPQRVVALCDRCEPLPLPKLVFYGIDLATMLGFVFVIGFVSFFGLPEMFEEVRQLKKARDTLCGGELHFVYKDTPMLPFFAWAFTPNDLQTAGDLATEDLVQRIVRRDFNYQMLKETKFTASRATAWSLQATNAWPMQQWTANFNPRCKDLLNVTTRSFFVYQTYETVLNNRFPTQAPMASCAEIKAYCDADSQQGIIARSVCPETCGCDHPFSHLVLSAPTNGCPGSCLHSFSYQQVRNTTPCVDKNWTELSARADWVYFANQLSAIAHGKNNTGQGWLDGAIVVTDMIKLYMLGKSTVTGCPFFCISEG